MSPLVPATVQEMKNLRRVDLAQCDKMRAIWMFKYRVAGKNQINPLLPS